MKNKNQTNNALRLSLCTGLLALGILASGGAQAVPVLAVDLTVNNSGTINTVDFIFDKLQPSGTGVLNPFLRIQNNGTEQGYNTNSLNVFDNKPPVGWTHDLKFSDLVADGGFYSFVLDIAEPVNVNNSESLLSLDGLKFYSTQTGGQSSETVDGDGNANGISGTLLWDMDASADNYVLLDANRNGQPGNGVSDMLLKVPASVFAGLGTNDYIVLWSRFGLQDGATSGTGSFGSFEEWAHISTTATPGTCADPEYAASHQLECGGGDTSNGGGNVPEPSSIALLGLGLLAGVYSSRHRSLQA